MMEEFSRWVADKQHFVRHVLTPNVKCDAFNLALEQRNNSLTKLIFNVYDLVSDKELFVQPLKEMASRKLYKEVCITVTSCII